MNTLGRDLNYAFRTLRRSSGFTAIAVLTLALGIGANTAVFSVFKAVVLDPFPYPDSSRLVQVWTSHKDNRLAQPFSTPNFLDVKEQSTSFAELGVYVPRTFNISDREPVRVQGIAATASALRALGTRPAIGRLFTDAEELEGNHCVVVLSDTLWKRSYGGDPEVLGRTIRVNGEPHQIIGVMPEEYEVLSPWPQANPSEIWAPLMLADTMNQRDSHWLLAIGRLKPGLTPAAAEAEARTIAARIAEEYPKTNRDTQVWLQPLAFEILGQSLGRLVILLWTVGLVLLIACANVASMLLAKGAGRRAELAIRTSLGASRKHIAGQLLTESLLLSMLGGAAGLLVALWSLDLVRSLIPPTMPRGGQVEIDGWVLLFTVALSVLTGLGFGTVPVRAASRTNMVDALKEGHSDRVETKGRNRTLKRLAVAQLAISLVLANCAILLFQSYRNVLQTPRGFDTEKTLTAEISLWGPNYDSSEKRTAFWEQFAQQVEALPGVELAAFTTKLPLEGGTNGSIRTEDNPDQEGPLTEHSYVSPDYFKAMGISLVSGQTLATNVSTSGGYGVVVNRTLAETCWPGENAIGKRILDYGGTPVVVVGMVENVHQWGPDRPPLPELYLPFEVNPNTVSHLVVRSEGDGGSLVPAIRAELSELDADLPLSNTRTMGDVFEASTRNRRFVTLLLDLFTAIALVLCFAGLYGLMSYHVAQRTHEIGVRVALGAARRSLLVMVTKQALALVLTGVAIGLLGTINAGFILRNLLYGISPLSLLSLSVGILVVTVGSLIATLLPALRAASVNPVQALRAE